MNQVSEQQPNYVTNISCFPVYECSDSMTKTVFQFMTDIFGVSV